MPKLFPAVNRHYGFTVLAIIVLAINIMLAIGAIAIVVTLGALP
jgi:hypothetical protein